LAGVGVGAIDSDSSKKSESTPVFDSDSDSGIGSALIAGCDSALVGVGDTNFGSAKAGVGVAAIDFGSSKNWSRLQFSTEAGVGGGVTNFGSDSQRKSESAPVFDSDSDSGVGVTVCSKLKTIIVEKMFLDFTFFWVKMRLILSIKFKS
jgi:hypothetical protein